MLARIAHELFWLGRNLSRAEHTARMLDGVFQIDLQARPDDPSSVTLGWGALLAIMGAGDGTPARRDDVLRALTIDDTNPASIMSCVARSREGARTVRDVISAEMWEAINTTHLRLTESDLRPACARRPPVPRGPRAPCPVLGPDQPHDAQRRGARFPPPAAIEAGDMMLRMLRVALPGVTTVTPRTADGCAHRRCCTRSVTSRPSAARARLAQRAAGHPLSCTNAPTLTRSPPSTRSTRRW